MALTFNIGQTQSPAPTGFTVSNEGDLGIKLSWDKTNPDDIIEIWWNNTNNSSTATKIATTKDIVYVDKDYDLTDSGTQYYWLKQTKPTFSTSNFTSVQSITIKKPKITSYWTSSSVASASGSVSTFGSYVDWFSMGFNYIPAENNLLVAEGMIKINFNPTLASGEDLKLDLKLIIVDETDNVDVNEIIFEDVWKEDFNKVYYSSPWFSFLINSEGTITPNHQHDVKVQYKVTRTGTPSLTLGYKKSSNMSLMFN